MGRAYEVRKASIQKTGAARGKIYSTYAKEIYQAAKNGGVEVTSNSALKRLIERAKIDQVPQDIIKRAIDKVNSGVDESYIKNTYEIFGPGGSTLIVDCLTDNVNRSVSDLRAVINKCHVKMGSIGSISYNYDNLCIVSFTGVNVEDALNVMIENDIDIKDIEEDGDKTIIYGNPQDLYQIKESIAAYNAKAVFDMEVITMLAKEKVSLAGEDLEIFNRMLNMLDDVEDVSNVYHNVENV